MIGINFRLDLEPSDRTLVTGWGVLRQGLDIKRSWLGSQDLIVAEETAGNDDLSRFDAGFANNSWKEDRL